MPTSSLPSDAANASASVEAETEHRVMVLGATGFLGRHVVRRLDELSVPRVAVARSATPNADRAIDLVTATQHEIDRLISAAAPTAVINCAGTVRGTSSELTRGNVVAVHALLSSLLWSAPSARIVQLGSSAEYGGGATGAPMNEETPAQPSSAYGFTKLAASELILRARDQGADAVVLRIFNVSGPESPTSTMLGHLVDQLHNAGAEPTLTLDSLDGWRDYVDARDVANAACLAALAASPPPIVNIGRGKPVQTGEWVRLLVAISQTRADVVVNSEAHPNHKSSASAVAWQCADVTLARNCLGWTPTIDLEESIRDTWATRQQSTSA